MPSSLLQVEDQVEDLRLDRHVQRGGRLVGDQQLRLAGQRHGDHRALPHAAGQLVRIFARTRCAGSGILTWRSISTALRRAAALRETFSMQPHRLGDLLADRHHRVERRSSAPERSSRSRCRGCRASRLRRVSADRVPSSLTRAGDDAAGRVGHQAHHRQRGHRSCRSRTRRRPPTSRRACSENDTSSTALDDARAGEQVGPQPFDLEASGALSPGTASRS